MSAKHTYTKVNANTASTKSIYVGAEFEASKLCLNEDIGIYVTFANNIIGHIALKDLGLTEQGEEYFKKKMLPVKFRKPFQVKVINMESNVKLIGTGKQMYDLSIV